VRSLYSSGIETTAYLLASVACMIFSHPSVLRGLREDPSRAGAVVRETLRYACPAVELPVRRANRDVRVGDATIAEGNWVRLVALKAERDPRRFSRPHEFDHLRTDHGETLAYGLGPHICLGRHLATMLAEEVGKALAEPGRGARMCAPVPEFRRRAALPVIWGPRWVHLKLA
jgi:cytochrome P450